MGEAVKMKKLKIAWGITGAGDKIAEILEVMKEVRSVVRGCCGNRGFSL